MKWWHERCDGWCDQRAARLVCGPFNLPKRDHVVRQTVLKSSSAARFGLTILVLGLGLVSAHGRAEDKPATTPTPVPPAAPADPAATAPPAVPSPGLPCPSDDNLLRTATPNAQGTTGWVPRTTDNELAEEGTFWSAPEAIVLPATAVLGFDMGLVRELRALVIQGDNNDEYVVEGSIDGTTYSPVWVAPATFVGMGLRTRSIVLPQPLQARYLRITGRGGDGFFSLSEVRAHCKVPAIFPPPLRLPPAKYGWDAIDNDGMVVIKGVVALVAGLWLFGAFWRRFYEARIRSRGVRMIIVGVLMLKALGLAWLGRIVDKNEGPAALLQFCKVHASAPGLYYSAGIVFATALVVLALCLRKQGPRIFDTGLAIVGLFSFFAWWNLGHYHFDHYIHIWEHYHYIMGAKYGPELRYARLYQCTGVADIQDNLTARVKARKVRRIETDNELGTSDQIIAHPELCTAHFKDPKRWEQFRSDIRFFRSRFSLERWDESQNDHGYNATPVWAIIARYIVDHVELTWDNIVALGIIDSVYLVIMWLAVLWAFGWRAAAVAALYWGLNFPARFYWNGGSFLRYDWQLWMVVGICFLRKNKHALGGAALTYGALLRVFPGFVIAALVLKALAGMVRERRIFLTRQHVRFAVGCLAALALLVPISGWATNGLDAWGEFAQNSKKHLATALTNNMGLKTVMGYDFRTRAINMRNDKLEDPFREWKDARHHFYRTRWPFQVLLIGLFCVMLARAGDREKEDWAVACLGTGLIVIGAELTCYYYGFLLTYGLLWERRKLPGILSSLLAAFTCFIYGAMSWNDDHFAAMSLASVVVVVAVTAQAAFGKRVNAPEQTPAAPALSDPSASSPVSLPPIVAEPH
jgi:hypothetical protein